MLLALPMVGVYWLLWPHDERRRRQFHRVLQYSVRFLAWIMPCVHYHVNNPEGETFERPAVIISNHQSMLDLVVVLMLSPNLVVMTKTWVWNFPLFSPFLRYCDFYPASDGLEQHIEKAQRLMQRGYSVVIFPEGTCMPEGHLGRFHRGAFYLAEQLGADILPLYLHGTGKALAAHSWHLRPGHITVRIGQRVANGDKRMGEGYRQQAIAWQKHYLSEL